MKLILSILLPIVTSIITHQKTYRLSQLAPLYWHRVHVAAACCGPQDQGNPQPSVQHWTNGEVANLGWHHHWCEGVSIIIVLFH